MKKTTFFYLVIFFCSCSSVSNNNNVDSDKNFLDSIMKESQKVSLQILGFDYYRALGEIEKKLLKDGIIKDTNRTSYINLFNKLFENNDDFIDIYNYVDSTFCRGGGCASQFNGWILSYYHGYQRHTYSNYDYKMSNIIAHMYALDKIQKTSYGDKEMVKELLILTDFDIFILRMDIVHIFLLNIDFLYSDNGKFEREVLNNMSKRGTITH